MIVLGIHDGHTAGAALVRDGVVLAAIAEERLVNVKNYSGPPLRAIPRVYEISGVSPSDTDAIAIGCLVRVGPPYADKNWLGRVQVAVAPYLHSSFFSKLYVKILHSFREMQQLRECFSQLLMADVPIYFVDHHLSHAACAYYQRPWKGDAVVLTLDGSGDGLSATVSVGSRYSLTRIAETGFYHSLSNNLYSEITGYLGMTRWEHEYKVMGLAAYGKDDGLIKHFNRVVSLHPTKPLEFRNTYHAYLSDVTKKLSGVLAGRRFDTIAWAVQRHFEVQVSEWVRHSIAHTGIRNVVCSGGSFLNVKANQVIRELKEVNRVFFYPACDDGGTPVGAALEGYVRLCREKRKTPHISPLSDIYYGQSFSDDEIRACIRRSRWKKSARYFSDGISLEAGKLLSEGKIIGRFSGRDEWGPRALGNRSILADPRNLNVVRRLNFAVKQRDFWMPFAPSILSEYEKTYLSDSRFSPYMIESFHTTRQANDIVAGIHPFDRTCRPQIVNEWNPSYRALLQEFASRTGVGGIVNTSFNLHGFPIVGTPERAIEVFGQSGLDALILNDWLLVK